MKLKFYLAPIALLFVLGTSVNAQISQVQMHIDGYLCGN
jgi:hypothetical protein